MTDYEIIKALEEMEGFKSLNNGSRIALHNAVYLINRQQAEIEKLNVEIKAMRGAANSYKTEVERLKGGAE